MASRIRSIHPNQWADEDFCSMEPLARLCCIALRNFSDDLGLLEYKPRKWRMQTLAYDVTADIEKIVNQMVEAEQIFIYETQGRRYAAFRNFLRYQRVNRPSAEYPLPDDETERCKVLDYIGFQHTSASFRERLSVLNGSLHDLNWLRNYLTDISKNQTLSDFDSVNTHGALRAKGDLFSESSVTTPAGEGEGEGEGEGIKEDMSLIPESPNSPASSSSVAESDDSSHTANKAEFSNPPAENVKAEPVSGMPKQGALEEVDIVNAWNKLVASRRQGPFGPQAVRVKWSDTLRKNFNSRCRDYKSLRTMEQWTLFFEFISRSKFLMGMTKPSEGHRPFQLSLGWVIKPTNMEKILNHHYHTGHSFMEEGDAPWDEKTDKQEVAA